MKFTCSRGCIDLIVSEHWLLGEGGDGDRSLFPLGLLYSSCLPSSSTVLVVLYLTREYARSKIGTNKHISIKV